MEIKKSNLRNVNCEAELVTVCVMSYNRPKLLDRTLECITQQTHKNLQIIISDDCSPDVETSKVIKRYAEKDQRIKYYIQKTNLFYFKNLNLLINKVESNFVMWCDDDDWYDSTFIAKCLSALLQNEKASTAFSYYFEAYESGEASDSYPNQAKLLERLTNKNTYFRLLAYLFTYNGFGYCNIYYGLHRKTILSWFDPLKFGMAIDADVGMKIISLGHLVLVKEHLFKKTVSNKKEYNTNTLKSGNSSAFIVFTKKVISALIDPVERMREYCKVLCLKHSIFIIIFAPLWISSILFSSFFHFVKKYLIVAIKRWTIIISTYLPTIYNTRYSNIFSLFGRKIELKKLKTNIITNKKHVVVLISETPHYPCAVECLKNSQVLKEMKLIDRSFISNYIVNIGLFNSFRYIEYVKAAHPGEDPIDNFMNFIALMDICLTQDYKFDVLVQRKFDKKGDFWLLIDGLHRSSILLALGHLEVSAKVKFP